MALAIVGIRGILIILLSTGPDRHPTGAAVTSTEDERQVSALATIRRAIALFTVLFQPSSKAIADGGDIVIVAGTLGSGGASGDGGPATSARLASPVDVAIDSSGSIYISSHANHAIRKVCGATVLITTVAGTLGPSAGRVTEVSQQVLS